MKYAELDKKKWKWLHSAIVRNSRIKIGEGELDSIQVAGLFISPNNNKLHVISIQGESYICPKLINEANK